MANVSPVIWGSRRPVGMADRPMQVPAPHHGIAAGAINQHRAALLAELKALGLGTAPRMNFIPGNALRAARR